MACTTLKRANPFEEQEFSSALSRSTSKRACSYSTMNMESSPSTSNAQATPNVLSGNFPLLNNDDFIKKVTKELQKGHTAKKNSNTTQQPKNPSTDRECASKEDAIFNSPQVRSLCDRLLKEREIEIRSEYDRLLSSKLSEQYETFVKFAQDQITRKTQPAEDFSYYS